MAYQTWSLTSHFLFLYVSFVADEISKIVDELCLLSSAFFNFFFNLKVLKRKSIFFMIVSQGS